jgi:hypothetical protein
MFYYTYVNNVQFKIKILLYVYDYYKIILWVTN